MNKSSRGQFYGMFNNEFKLEPYLLYPRSPKGEGGILFYLCPSVRPSVRPKYFIIPPLPEGGGGYTVLRLSVQDIFRRIFLSNLMAEI
jgi:hypothetical protein